MPGLVTMKPLGPMSKAKSASSKALALAKDMEDQGLGALQSQVRMSPSKKGRRPTDLQAVGRLTRSNRTKNLRMKLLGEERDVESTVDPLEDVKSESERESEPSSECLAAMVEEFLESEINEKYSRGRSPRNSDDRSSWTSSADEDTPPSLVADLYVYLQYVCSKERILLDEVSKVVVAAKQDGGDMSELRHQVMKHLRRAGYNAGICKSKWDYLGGIPGCDYEYVDVIYEGPSTGEDGERIIIDIDFKAQFEIARPTAGYDALVRVLPSVFVGKVDQLDWIINLMCDAVKLSLKKRGMHLPPWRKPEYMRAKWFSDHKRKANDTTLKRIGEGEDPPSNPHPCKSGVLLQSSGCNPTQKPEPVEKHATKGSTAGAIRNDDWQPPMLKPRKSQGPGHAGLASLFKTTSLSTPMNHAIRDQGLDRKSFLAAAAS
ncbi:uncharacterized protein [Physcomitrium patens]|uniref:DUF506 family protein n=1 Tax=Physcomitrium patens TaxID=3218 RepID=A0A2K1L4J1_PHYPA|nr:uncharacterized protein LOC112279007 [Physcomitrium patens]PNR60944.1 hypothetical protein PHYPA_003737 [Physcomitrium patens]|eukprot:XP_024368804.1 uncharacterized protein LOC112279007 [Physcomitrella patens]